MLIQIGASNEPAGVVSLLRECHVRIRSFVRLAVTIARSENASPAEVRDAASRVLRYFSEALPLHVADEEQSILPRLAHRSREVDAALEAMHHEHEEHEPMVEALLDVCRTLRDSPEKLGEVRPSLLVAASSLDEAFQTHLEREEQIVCPAIAALLTVEEQDAILAELRARRSDRPS